MPMTAVVVAWVAASALSLNYLAQLALMIRHLQQTAPGTFEVLGSPSFRGMSGATALGVLSFVLRREYRALGDNRLVQLGDRARLGFFLAIAGTGAFIAALGCGALLS